MWRPNSERGHKIRSLEGENEIPHIPIFDFLNNLQLQRLAPALRGHYGYYVYNVFYT